MRLRIRAGGLPDFDRARPRMNQIRPIQGIGLSSGERRFRVKKLRPSFGAVGRRGGRRQGLRERSETTAGQHQRCKQEPGRRPSENPHFGESITRANKWRNMLRSSGAASQQSPRPHARSGEGVALPVRSGITRLAHLRCRSSGSETRPDSRSDGAEKRRSGPVYAGDHSRAARVLRSASVEDGAVNTGIGRSQVMPPQYVELHARSAFQISQPRVLGGVPAPAQDQPF